MAHPEQQQAIPTSDEFVAEGREGGTGETIRVFGATKEEALTKLHGRAYPVTLTYLGRKL